MSPHAALAEQAHRPWPIPATPWTWRQSWRDLLFAHWPVSASALAHLVPAPLKIQEFEGTSWVGVVPFQMAGVMRRPLPDLPWISAFPELNLRLYVEHNGKPGVWFLSLDATNPVVVWTARKFFHLPYEHASISIERPNKDDSEFAYASRRKNGSAEFVARYAPTSPAYATTKGTLEHWLTERYALYAQAPGGALFCADVHHKPWPLQKARAEITTNDLTTAHGFTLEGPPVLSHFSKRIDVVVWSPTRIND